MTEWMDKRIESLANLVQSAFLNEEEKERFREDLASFHLLKLNSLHLKQLIKLWEGGTIGSDQFWSEWEKLAHPHNDRMEELLAKGRINFNEQRNECIEIGYVEHAYIEDYLDDYNEVSRSPNAEFTDDLIPRNESIDLNDHDQWRKWSLRHFVVRQAPTGLRGMLTTQNLPLFIKGIESLKNEAFLLEKTSDGKLAERLGEDAVNLAVSYLLGEPSLNPKTGEAQHNWIMLNLGTGFVEESYERGPKDCIADAIEALKEDIIWLQAEFARERSGDS